MYSSAHGEGPIAVLTPVEIEEEPRSEKSLTAPFPDETSPIEAEGESEGTGEDLPKELQRKGLIGFLTGRISVKIVVPFIVFNFCMDRGASHQLYDAEHCSYAPWNHTIKKIAQEEAGHLQHGDLWVQRMGEDPASHDEVQSALDRWYPRVMNIFGRPNTPKNQLYRQLGLKVRDNDEVRQAFVEDVTPKLEAWRLRRPTWSPPWEGQSYDETRDEARYVTG